MKVQLDKTTTASTILHSMKRKSLFKTTAFITIAILLSACGPTKPDADELIPTKPHHKEAVPHSQPQQDVQYKTLPSVDLDPELTYHLLVAEFARTEGDYATASRAYLEAARATKDPRLAKYAVQTSIYNKDLNMAEIAAYFWVNINNDDPESNQSYGALLIQKGELEQAEPYIRRVLQHTETNKKRSYSILANMLAKAKDQEKALDFMDRIAADDRHSEDFLYASAILAHRFDMIDETEQRLDELLSRNRNHRNATLLRARIYYQQGDTKRALALALEGVEQHPEDNELRLFYGRLLVNTKQYKQGLTQFRILSGRIKDNNDIRYSLGLLAVQAKEFDEAEIQFQTLINNGQSHVDESRYSLAQIAENRGDITSAISWYSSVEYGDHYYVSQYKAAQLLVKQQNIEVAVKHLRSLQYMTPEDQFKGLVLEGELFQNNRNYPQAVDAYGRALAINPQNVDILYAHAMAAEQIGRIDILEKDLKQLIIIEPDNAQALNALGYTLADRTQRYKEALGYIERAYKIKPDDPAILDSMGWVLYRLGRSSEAVKYLRQAANKHKDGEISAHLGEVLWSMGDKQNAQTVWEDALKFAPEHPVLLKTIKNHNQ